MANRRGRWQRLSVTAPVTLTVGAGATAAGANFVAWPVAVVLGALSGGAELAGALLWQRWTDRRGLHREWVRLVDTGPGSDSAAARDSLLTGLNPDQEMVAFSPLRAAEVRRLLQWCTDPSPQRLWLVTGDAGCGKTRLLIEAVAPLDPQWAVGWVRRGKGPAAAGVAARWNRRVLLVFYDADTHHDLAETLTTVVGDSDHVLVLAAARDTGEWWPRLRATLATDVAAGPQARLGSLHPRRIHSTATLHAGHAALGPCLGHRRAGSDPRRRESAGPAGARPCCRRRCRVRRPDRSGRR
jgi:hypothetical protein